MNVMKTFPASLTLLSLSLVACGGTLSSLPTQPGAASPVLATQTVSGTITALAPDRSRLTVAGQTISLSGTAASASLRAQGSGSSVRVNGKLASPKALSVGQEITVTASDGQATDVNIALEIKGRIDAIDLVSKTVTVAGQTVRITASTRIDLDRDEDTAAQSTRTISDLSAGVFVEVSGVRGADGDIVASKVEVKGAAELEEDGEKDRTELKGILSDLNAADKSFTVKGVQVTYAAAQVEGTPVNGAAVKVEGSYAASTRTLVASQVELKDKAKDRGEAFAPGTSVVIEEEVRSLNLADKTLTLKNTVVEFAAAKVSGQLAVDVKVRIVGKVDAADSSLIHASTVEVRAED